jgi:fluoroacetyl-CoA thioesterase
MPTPGLAPGLEYTHRYTVAPDKTVPHLYREAVELAAMPEVFATAFLVGLMEWACIRAIAPHLEAGEQTVGTGIALQHTAATPPGFEVTVQVRLDAVEGKKLRFTVSAHDGVDSIGTATHERFVIDAARFKARVAAKAGAQGPAA